MANSVMYSLHKIWCDKIFSGEKTLEFRTKLPKNLSIGTKIYLYETKKKHGAGAVVGECIVKDIIPVLNKNGKWPMYGCYPFLEYYCENVTGDLDVAEHIRKVKEEFEYKFDNYRHGYIASYLFSEANLESLRTHGKPVDTWGIFDYNILRPILDDLDAAHHLMESCDDWLMDIGYYNDFCETNYQYGLVLSCIKKYDKPISVTEFTGLDGAKIKNAPQSYCYITDNETPCPN